MSHESSERPESYANWRQARSGGALLFHHSRPLAYSPYDLVLPTRLTDLSSPTCPKPTAAKPYCPWDDWHDALHMEAAYRWLAERVGFWPLFLAVGSGEDTLRMTGYEHQFARILAWHKSGNTYRAKGDFPSDALFSWREPPALVRFTDYSWWHVVLNSHELVGRHRYALRDISPYYERCILRPSWNQARWLTKALKEPGSTQAVAPQLDLRSADLVRVRSKQARAQLLERGFTPKRVEVWRMPVRRWW